ncbi:MAG: diguanylate cyclase [Microvirga sp.]|nr:diguanylate cyclase [Microvirga sp.]
MDVCAASDWSIGLLAALALGVSFGSAVLTFWTLRQRLFPGRDWFVGANIAMVWWLAAAGFEIAVVDSACKTFAASLAWGGIILLPIFWAGFLSRYVTSSDERLRGRRVLLAFIAPVLAVAAALTNPTHGLFYGPATGTLSDAPGAAVVFDHGPLFFAFAAYLYVFLAFSLWIVARAAFTARGAHRRQFGAFLIITSVPIVANLSYIVGGVTLFGYDPTPFSFAVTLATFAWVIVGAGLFDLVPIAHRRLLAMLPDPVVVIDEAGRIVSANPAALALAGVADEPVGAPLETLPVAGPALAALLGRTCREAGEHPVSLGDPLRNFDLRVVEIGRGRGSTPLGWMLYLRDVTSQEQVAEYLRRALTLSEERLSTITDLHRRLQRQAARDPLTDLHNRRHLDDFLSDALREAVRVRDGGVRRLALAMIDLDGFKALNDAHGHLAGDDVLREFALRLAGAADRDGLAFRIGGEEFLLAMPDLDAAGALDRLAGLRESLAREAFRTRAGPLYVTFSAGLAVAPQDGAAPDPLLQAADRRLYAAKRAGRDQFMAGDAPPSLPRAG